MIKRLLAAGALVLLVCVGVSAQVLSTTPATERAIAITIDDLPVIKLDGDLPARQMITRKLIAQLRAAKVPATGFVNETKLYKDGALNQQEVALLRQWLQAGLELGNHTFSHPDINNMPLADFFADITKGETVTKQLATEYGLPFRYFRHPYLHVGADAKTKTSLAEFLLRSGYTVAPVTVDNDDYVFARAYDIAEKRKDSVLVKKVLDSYVPYMAQKLEYYELISNELFGRPIKQILLIHANSINAAGLSSLFEMFKNHGYGFVTLAEALKDPAYASEDGFIGKGGISWLERWAITQHKTDLFGREPKLPEFVNKLFSQNPN
jgi:peptidoglycan/xylan/chitin deacetylase (PgdA/CDA1 family)